MALASGSTPETTGPRCCDSALAYNDAPAQQEQLQQVASSDAQPPAAAAVASSDAQPLAAMTTSRNKNCLTWVIYYAYG